MDMHQPYVLATQNALPEATIVFDKFQPQRAAANLNRAVVVEGDAGDDGNDTVDGQSGDDHMFGNRGKDLLRGGNGNDDLHGGTGNDRVLGGAVLGSTRGVADGANRVGRNLPGYASCLEEEACSQSKAKTCGLNFPHTNATPFVRPSRSFSWRRWNVNGSMKILATHRERQAVVYLRQSSTKQVLENRESYATTS